MTAESRVILEHLLIAMTAGALIGLERTFHGRPAGFRTHTLVCVASSALMLVTIYQGWWFRGSYAGAVSIDPTRMAQGIMTGIGFLGAGVIFKERLSVRGLTTAASIWITAAIGILAGIGFYFPLIVTAVITLGTLSVFRWIEVKMPVQSYARLEVKFSRGATMSEEELRRFIGDRGFSIANLNYRYNAEADFFEYGMVIRTVEPANLRRISEDLPKTTVREFVLLPMGE
jgi:putative Mg2+ transporter-C (MgtC) family protein